MEGIKKKRYALFCAASLLANTAANAADWFDNAGASMGRIEPSSDGSVWLMVPVSAPAPVNLVGHSSTCLVTQIHLIPPANQEKAWLATLLAAAAAGKAISVYGDCYPSNSRMDATRLVIEY
jgi:hypothetical protein